MIHCTGQIKTHNRRLGKQDASPAKSPEKAESFVPDDPLEESLGPEDPLEAFWPLGVAGLPKMALMSESLVAAPHRQTVRLAITHAYMCNTCSDVLYMQRHMGFGCACQLPEVVPRPLCSHDTHAQRSNCQLSNLFSITTI